MRNLAADQEIFARWEHSVEFRLFSDAAGPTLTVPEWRPKVGDRIIGGVLTPGARIGEQGYEFAISRGPVRGRSASWSARAWSPCCRVAALW